VQGLTFIGSPADSFGRGGGAERAPAVLRELGLPAALGGGDAGDLEVGIHGEERDPGTGLLASAEVLASTAGTRAAIAARLDADERPFLAGGCCSLLPGALAGARDARGRTPGLVYLDGHADLYDGRTSTSGEAADMPISVALGLGPSAWVEAAGGAGVAAADLALVGYRDREESIADGMRQPETLSPAPTLRPLERLRAEGAAAVAAELSRTIAAAPFWLHFDVDVLDSELFAATDYRQPDGLGWEEVGAILDPLLAAPNLIGASLGCYNPDKDPGLACGRALVAALTPRRTSRTS
jgi:arginase